METTVAAMEKTADEMVESAILLHPKMGIVLVAEMLAGEAEPEFREEYCLILLVRDFASRARKSRAAEAKREREKQLKFEFHFPGLLEHLTVLPARLRDGSLHVSDYRAELKRLNADDRERHKNSKRRAAIQAVIDMFPKSPKKRRISLAEVDALKAKKAGLIE